MAQWENPRISGIVREREKIENTHLDGNPEEIHPLETFPGLPAAVYV